MNRGTLPSVLLILVALSLTAGAQERSPATGESRRQDDAANAKALLEGVAAVLKDSPAIAFVSEVGTSIESIEVGKIKAKVLLERPNRARLELSGLGQDALIILDGATSWHYVKASKGFVKSKQIGTMKLEQYGAGPAATLFFEKGVGALQPYLSNATVAREKFDGDDAAVVAWRVGTEETRLWISGNRLRRWTTTRRIEDHRLEQTIDYGVVDLAPKIPDAAFEFVPPAGAHRISPGDESKLLGVEADAPDFDATTSDGKGIRLSDFKGKPVLLTFWFHACANCREELSRLQKLDAEYAKRGLVVLAVDFGDKADVVGEYFQKEKFTFAPLLQKKNEVSIAFGVQAYPTNYAIRADGKIAWRATGFDEASVRSALDEIAPAK